MASRGSNYSAVLTTWNDVLDDEAAADNPCMCCKGTGVDRHGGDCTACDGFGVQI